MTDLAPLRVESQLPPDAQHLPVFEAHGDLDDHLRLSVLLASHLPRQAVGVGLADATEVCLDPRTSWPGRLAAVDHLLRQARPRDGRCFGVFFDLDALDPGPLDARTRWDDRDFGYARKALLGRIRQALRRGGWIVVRPNPSADIVPLESVARPAGADATQEVISQLAPECQPIASWLLRRRILIPNQLRRALDAADGDPARAAQHFVSVAYEAITESAVQAAFRIAVLRRSLPYNGHLGPLKVVDDETARFLSEMPVMPALPAAPHAHEVGWVLQRAVEELLDCGFLQSTASGALRMPRTVRKFLLPRARAVQPETIGVMHRWLASADIEPGNREQETEAHFHAVEVSPVTPDAVARALETARYYRSTLREMAIRLSLIERRHADAAVLYEEIVQKDPTDAYAWEYLGYNLARHHENRPIPPKDAEKIQNAYSNAVIYSPDNPLYDGRLVGFLARIGYSVEAEFNERMKTYLEPSAPPEGVSYFARAALDGMPPEQRRRVAARWRRALESYPELAPFLADSE